MEPTFDRSTSTIDLPEVAGVSYSINGLEVSDQVVIDKDTVVVLSPTRGFAFAEGKKAVFEFDFAPVVETVVVEPTKTDVDESRVSRNDRSQSHQPRPSS